MKGTFYLDMILRFSMGHMHINMTEKQVEGSTGMYYIYLKKQDVFKI